MMDALRLLDDAEVARAYKFTPREIRYLLWHVDSKSTYTPTDKTIGDFLKELRDGLIQIKDKPVAIDVTGAVTKTYFTKIFGASATAIIDQAMEIVAGTNLTGAAGFINANFASFMDPDDAIEKLVTAGPDFLDGADARFAYMQPIVQVFVDRQTRVIDRVASAFGLTNVAADAIVRSYVHARTGAGAVDSTKTALVLLSAIDAVSGDLTLSGAPAYWYTYLHLQKVGTIVSRLKLADGDLAWTFEHGPLAIDALPVVATESPTAFAAWARLVRAAQLRDSFLEKELFDIFQAAWSGGSSLGAVLADIADRTGWSNDDLTYLAANLSPAITYPNDFKDERALVRIKRALDVCGRLELPAKTALPWADTTNGDTSTEATAIKTAIRGTFDANAWPAVVKPTRDAIRERQRDAMVTYLVATSSTFKEPVDLSDDLLMDVQVGSCAKTSRIKQAISSTQTFIQRIFLNYETAVSFTTDDARQWQWMKAFRLWEANRKIFLYPENWIEPTLRDNKSELFERLETDLSKGELTNDLIEDALLAYLHGLDEVAHLDPVATVVDEDTDLKRSQLHVVARTKAQPHIHYHRMRETTGRWLGWRKMDIDIQSDHVLLTIYNRRPYLLWAQVASRPDPAGSNPKVPDQLYELRLRWTSLRHGTWGKVQQSAEVLTAWRVSSEDDPIRGVGFATRYSVDSDNDLILRVTDFGVSEQMGDWAYFRITGGQGIGFVNQEPSLSLVAAKKLRSLVPSHVAPNANFFRQKSVGLGLPDVFNSYSKSKTSQLAVLDDSPTPYKLVTGGALDDTWATQPTFYSDLRRCFMVVPSVTLKQPTTSGPSVPSSGPPVDTTNSSVTTWSSSGSGVAQKLNFEQNSTTSDNYSSKLLNLSTVVQRPSTHTAFTFSAFHHPLVREVLTQLNRLGVERLYDPQPGKPGADLRRQAKSVGYFNGDYSPTPWVTLPYPRDDFDFTPDGAYSLYNWELFFHIPLLIATKLAADQQFEEARKWFHFIFNPTEPKAPSAPSGTEDAPQRFWKVKPFHALTAKDTAAEGPIQLLKLLLSHDDDDPDRLAARKLVQQQVEEWRENPFEPHRIARLRPVAYMKTTVIKYLDMLIAWGDQLFARSTLESINEALQIYIVAYRVLGKRPTKLPAQSAPATTYDTIASTLDEFSDALLKIETAMPPVNDDVDLGVFDTESTDQRSMLFCVPANEKLLGYWDTVEDRLYKIRHCLNLQGIAVNLPLFEPPIDPGLLVRARAAGIDVGSLLDDVNAPLPIQRYAVLAQRANELAAEVKSLGQSFLSALEKQDAEALGLLRAGQEIQVMQAMRVSKAQAVVDAQRAREALQGARDAAVAKRDYYASRAFRNEDEVQQADALALASEFRDASQVAQAVAAAMQVIPSFQTGVSGLGLHLALSIGGSTLGAIASTTASALGIKASRSDVEAQLAGVQGTFRRRMDDWKFQRAQADIEIQNLEKQIAAAEIREAITQNDLETQDLQIQNSIDTRDFMRDKFTNVALYDYMVSQLAAVYFQAYKLAFDAARRAERAWHFEIQEEGEPSSFITFGYWDGLRKGLLAGEKLALDLKRMEMAYLDQNKREFELVRHVPLTLLDPEGLQELREKGFTEVDIPESFFDIDSPGHYLRRIRNVSITIAGTTGEYTPVRCTLTLIENKLRTRALLATNPLPTNTFPVQSIVTSSGRDDGGLFETNLRDERYLPFEGAGAISKWRLELPTVVPLFDYRTISEVVLHLRYTARDGGATFRATVNAALEAGVSRQVGFSAKSVFSNEWYRFVSGTDPMTLALDADHIPFAGTSPEITAVQLVRVRVPAPGGSSFNLSLTPPSSGASTVTMSPVAALGNQHGGAADYSSAHKALGDWSLAHSTALTVDDDLFVIVTYVTSS